MAISNKPNLAQLWAETGSLEAPIPAKISQGWIAEIPPYETQNWWQNRTDQALQHIYQSGIAVWDSSTSYTANRSLVQSSDGQLWRAVVDNTGQNPLTTSGVWTRLIQEGRYVPAGAVIEFATPNVPAGYLLCDGSVVSRTAYADLFAVIGTVWGVGNGTTTFQLPDYRGLFRRGFDAGRGLDPGRVFAQQQISTNLAHNHSGTTNNAGFHGHTGGTSGAGNHVHSGSTSPSGDHTHQVDRTVNGPIITVPAGFGNFVYQYGGGPSNTFPAGNHAHSLSIDAAGGHTHDVSINGNGDHVHVFATANAGGTESRPINQTSLVCIKF